MYLYELKLKKKKKKDVKLVLQHTNFSFLFSFYACIKGQLEPTHLKSLPLFTFSTKSLGQDSPSVHLYSITIGSKFTAAKIKLDEDSPS